MAVIKQGLKGSNIIGSNSQKNSLPSDNSQPAYGKVFGVVNGINLPTPKMYEKVNGRLGTIFYLDINTSKNIESLLTDSFLDTCLIAYPLISNESYYPLLEEIVELVKGPSVDSINSTNNINITYWGRIVNLFGNNQSNIQSKNPEPILGKTFRENENIKNLINYEGDYILSGRKGNSIRFSSTVGLYSSTNSPNYNEWSLTGQNGSPILILSNGHNYTSTKSLFYVEQINKDDSSIYLTSTQSIPIDTENNLKSPLLGEPIKPNKYFESQVILNANRILLNSKKDEIILLSKTNSIIKSKGISIIGDSVEIISNDIYLGKNTNGDLPSEPALLGSRALDMMEALIDTLEGLSNDLSSAVDSNGAPIAAAQVASENLNSKLTEIRKYIDPSNSKEYIASNQVFLS
jgi:hypothetical protein